MSFIVTFFRCSQGHQVEKREKNSKDIYIGGSPRRDACSLQKLPCVPIQGKHKRSTKVKETIL